MDVAECEAILAADDVIDTGKIELRVVAADVVRAKVVGSGEIVWRAIGQWVVLHQRSRDRIKRSDAIAGELGSCRYTIHRLCACGVVDRNELTRSGEGLGKVACALQQGRYGQSDGRSRSLSAALKAKEEEGAVTTDRSTDGDTVDVVAEFRLVLAAVRVGSGEVARSVEGIVTQKLVGRPVEFVRAGLCGLNHNAAGRTAELCAVVIADDANLLNRIHRRTHFCGSDADAYVLPGTAVQPCHRTLGSSAGEAVVCRVNEHSAACESHNIHRSPIAEWELRDALGLYGLTDRRRTRFKFRCTSGHIHALFYGASR